MKGLVVICLVVCILAPVYAQPNSFPTDGNGLLDACSVLVNSADTPPSLSTLTSEKFPERMSILSWCAGYLDAIQGMLVKSDVDLALIGMSGVTFVGPDKAKQFAFDTLKGACIPDKVPVLQLARVLVKWLREHPERLHESKVLLTLAALKEAFPCEQSVPKEPVKPTADKH